MRLLRAIMPVAVLAMPALSTAEDDARQHDAQGPPGIVVSETLDLLTLNVAHARGTSLNQLLVSAPGHRENLENIAATILASGVHVAALQEADAPSLWSGSFDHVEYLAQTTDFHSSVHGQHADSWLFSYGAALVSKYQLEETRSHRFRPSWPTAGKGFVVGSLQWQAPGPDVTPTKVTLASVHLDFSRESVRQDQIAEVIKGLKEVNTPLIVMGDFNADWSAGDSPVRQDQINEVIEGLKEVDTPLIVLGDFNADWSTSDSPVRQLASGLGLSVYRPEIKGLYTYKESKRLDWILISPELRFVEYDVLPDVVSDHLALVAKIGWRQQNEHYVYD